MPSEQKGKIRVSHLIAGLGIQFHVQEIAVRSWRAGAA
jgi:hypothetical protein